MNRYIWAHALQGGLMLGALYHPSAFGYGLIAGGVVGILFDNLRTYKR